MKEKVKDKKIIRLMILAIVLFFGLTITNCVQAASASISVSNANPTVGDTVTITGNVTAGAWNLKLSGDGIETKGLVGQTGVQGNASGSVFATFKATTPGTYTFYLKGDMTDYNDQYSEVSQKKTITVKAASSGGTTGSNSGNTGGSSTGSGSSNNSGTDATECYLSSLSLSPAGTGLSPKFNKDVYKYTMTVENDVTSVKISAKPVGGKYNVTGHNSLQEGTNAVKITVGGKTTYTVYVTRKAAEGDVTPNTTDEQNPDEKEKTKNLRLTAIALDEEMDLVLDPVFDPEIFEYTVKIGKDVTSLKINGIPNVDGAKVEITGNEELTEDENIITITVSADGYETVTYKVKVIREEAQVVGFTSKGMLQYSGLMNHSDETKKLAIIIGGLAALITFIGIIFAILEFRRRHTMEDKEEDDGFGGYNNYDYRPLEAEETEDMPEGTTVDVAKEAEEKENNLDWDEEKPKKRSKGKHF